MNLLRIFLTLVAVSMSCVAQSDYVKKVEADLKSATERLNEQRAQLSEKQIELSIKVTALQNELLTKRRQADISRRTVSDNEAFLRSLKNKEYASGVVANSLNDELRVYGMQLATKLFPGEAKDARLDGAFTKDGTSDELIKLRLIALESGLSRLEKAFGGSTYQGAVTDESAKIVQGDILSFGPARWFVSEDKSASGSYHVSPSWQVASLHEGGSEAAELLASGQEANAVIDITGGKAQALADIKSNPIDLIIKGGLWVYPILLIGLASLICAALKIFQLRKITEPKDSWINGVISSYVDGDKAGAVSQSSSVNHPISKVLPDCIDAAEHGLEVVEEILYERMITVKESLRRWLPFIATTAAIAPLLGLLGTVSGLIRTFSVIAVEGTGEAQSISGGISEALITTLFGLAIAIPAFMAHSLLSRKSKGVEQNTERLTLKFINTLRQLPISHGK